MSSQDARKSPPAQRCATSLWKLVQTVKAIQVARGESPWLLVNLTMAQLKATMLLVESGGARSRELADALGIAPSAVTPLVDRLVDQKFAERHDDADDRRIIWIRPTDKAIRLHNELVQTNERVLADVFAELPAGVRPQVHEGVRLLVDAAERLLEKTGEAPSRR